MTLDFSRPDKPTENMFIESFNGKIRDELHNGEVLDTLLETRVQSDKPHSSMGYRPPAPEAVEPQMVING